MDDDLPEAQCTFEGYCHKCSDVVEFDRQHITELYNDKLEYQRLSYMCLSCLISYTIDSDTWGSPASFDEEAIELEIWLEISDVDKVDAQTNGHRKVTDEEV